jgi:Domain of unknown function (DUF4136)
MKRILPFALAILFAGCATSPDVRTDFDPAAHFASYHTYTWLGKPTGISPLVEQRIVQGVDAHLQAKGWQPASSADTADVAVVANTVTQQQTTLDTFYTGGGYAGWGWRGGMGMGTSTTTVRTYTQGTLIVDLFDAKTKQAIWRGTGTATVPKSPTDVTATVQAALDKMFANFPPGSAPSK